MAHKTRPRMIYPGLWDSGKFCRLSVKARLLWVFLVSQADDDGRGRIVLTVLAGRPFLGIPIDEAEAAELVAEIGQSGLVQLYAVGGCEYYQLHDWGDFQTVRARDYKESTYPPPDGSHTAASGQPHGSHTASKCLPSGIPNVSVSVSVRDSDRDSDSGDPPDAQASPEIGVRLAKLLQAALREAHPTTRPTATIHDAEQIRAIAGRLPEDDIAAMIRWAAADPFIGPMLMARGGPGAKFRQHFDMIQAKYASRTMTSDEAWAQAERELREEGFIT